MLAGAHIKQRGRMLRTNILHRAQAVGKTGDARHRQRLVEQHGGVAERVHFIRNHLPRGDVRRRQPLQKVGAGDTAAIDTQRHRRMRVAGGEYLAPAPRMILAQAFDPPGGMLAARQRIGIGQRQQFIAPAQKIAQHAIHQPLEFATGDSRRRRHRLIDRGVRIFGAHFQSRQRHQQQCAHQ
jgi:hypothetical protein